MKKSTLILISALMTTTATHAAESTSDAAGQMVNPNAQYTYAETAECLISIGTYGKTSSSLSKTMENSLIAMLGQLPACEVEKIILAGGNEQAKKWILQRKSKANQQEQ